MPGQNIVILCSDEHARSVMGCSGHPVVQTPALDKLAAGGVRFRQAYTSSPICISARASLATGLEVHEHRCWSSAEPYAGQTESWMHRLRDAGHTAVSIGKLHFRSEQDDTGFSEEILPMHVTNEGRGWPQGLLRNPLPNFPDAADLARDIGPGESSYSEYDRKITAAACDWLERYPVKLSEKPWALFVSFVSPHYPLRAPNKFFDLYDGLSMPEPYGASATDRPGHDVLRQMAEFWDYDRYFDAETRALARRCYYGLCSFMDDNVAQVLVALAASGAASDTTVIYTSDHGEMLGNHGFWAKSVMYEDAVAVPMILHRPGLSAGVNNTLVSLSDVAATIEQTVGLTPKPPAASWQARSLFEFAAKPDEGRILLSQYHDGGAPCGFYMLRQGPWKYVYYAGGSAPQLFHLETDPFELADLGLDEGYRGERQRLQDLLYQILDPEAVNREAFADQKVLLDAYGGPEAVLAMPSFKPYPGPVLTAFRQNRNIHHSSNFRQTVMVGHATANRGF